MKKKYFAVFIITIMAIFVFSCSDDDDTNSVDEPSPTRFRITVTNSINYLRAIAYNTPVGDSIQGPLTGSGDSYQIEFYAVAGSRLSFASKLAATNDRFFAPNGSGIALFIGTVPVTGDVTGQLALWDAGTEAENPATIATEPDGETAGDPDPDNSVRDETEDGLSDALSEYLTASLSHTVADGRNRFTLTITRTNRGIITPGILVVHAQDNPLFTVGEADRGVGIERLAEAGMPTDIYEWFTAQGTSGAPLRLSASLTPLSPGVAYVFDSTNENPLFTQGESAIAGSGLEELAEDGNNSVALEYLEGNGISAVANSDGNTLPGNSLSFELEAIPGDRLGFAAMFVQSNDWFVSPNDNGISLFDQAGMPVSGTDFSVDVYLFDAGTEVDEPVGFGDNQPPRNVGMPNRGDADQNTTIRRVGEIEDLQFGKGEISSAPGVVSFGDARGGYNFVLLNIEPLN